MDSCKSIGFSRISYYACKHAYETEGIFGLLPKKPGPKQPSKLTEEVLAFIEQQCKQTPPPGAEQLQTLVAERLGVTIHKRTIQRALQGKKK